MQKKSGKKVQFLKKTSKFAPIAPITRILIALERLALKSLCLLIKITFVTNGSTKVATLYNYSLQNFTRLLINWALYDIFCVQGFSKKCLPRIVLSLQVI